MPAVRNNRYAISFAHGLARSDQRGRPGSGSQHREETPKRGGTLTYMIPADAPPSLDGHREETFAMLHAVAPFYSVLMRVDPENPVGYHPFRLRSLHRDSEIDG
jgi:hypothetical protein